MEEVIKLNSVDQYNKMYGLETLHPLVTVVDLSKATVFPTHFTLNYGLYALFLKQTKCGDLRYGRQMYDYQEGTVTSSRSKAKRWCTPDVTRDTFPSRPYPRHIFGTGNQALLVLFIRIE